MVARTQHIIGSPARLAYRCAITTTFVAATAFIFVLAFPTTQWFLLPAYFVVTAVALVCGLLALSLRGAERLVYRGLAVTIFNTILMLGVTVSAFSLRMGAP
jgi:hypothetical protein